MNTFWLKIAGLAVVVVVLIVGIAVFTSSEPKQGREREVEPKPREKTVYDQWEEDEKRLTAEPQLKEQPLPEQTTKTSGNNHIVQPGTSVEQLESQFKKLSPEDEVQAQQMWEWVKTQRKMSRLPVMGYGQMVETCRNIIRRWPESKYAFYAKRALADLPERYQKMYNITKEEIDLGNLK